MYWQWGGACSYCSCSDTATVAHTEIVSAGAHLMTRAWHIHFAYCLMPRKLHPVTMTCFMASFAAAFAAPQNRQQSLCRGCPNPSLLLSALLTRVISSKVFVPSSAAILLMQTPHAAAASAPKPKCSITCSHSRGVETGYLAVQAANAYEKMTLSCLSAMYCSEI